MLNAALTMAHNTKMTALLMYLSLFCIQFFDCHSFILSSSSKHIVKPNKNARINQRLQSISEESNSLNDSIIPVAKVDSYDKAMSIIDKCSKSKLPSDDLYDAVRYIDKKAFSIYPNDETKAQMWSKAYGSWKLVLATGGGRYTTFKPVPIFAFAYIDENNFGNGIGINEKIILLSLLGPHFFNTKRRQMMICIDDFFLFSKLIDNDSLPSFMKDGMGLGKRPSDYYDAKGRLKKKGSRMPAFTFIASSDDSLVARGGSGGIAIWTRLKEDIVSAAYSREKY
mmetsp:Transcript_29363/g.34049  ORF Transcript_29363/g.34049 Transcript_29363/m.34049 type:complete len:282 (-) Transcript_29363:9-854(-)